MSITIPPSRTLRPRPDLDQLRRQAKELLDAFLANEPHAVAEVHARYHHADAARFALHDAQLVLARSYGFESWAKLKGRVDGVTVDRLCDAVGRGDTGAAHHLLRRRPEIVDLEWPEHGECRALHVAVMRRDAPMVRLLMDHGADARTGIYPNRDATGPFTIATERGYDDIVAILEDAEQRRREARQAACGTASGGVSGGVSGDVSGATSRGVSGTTASVTAAPEALFDAAMWENGQAVAMLVADPALARSSHPEGFTPLHAAAATLHAETVEWLLALGADVHARGKGEWTPLDLAACGRGWSEQATPEQFVAVAAILRRHGAVLSAISAVALGDADWIRARHAEGALATAPTLHVLGPFGGLLSIAVRHERPEMLALLLDLGLDPDERLRIEGTDDLQFSWGQPLHACAGSGKLAMAEMLLDRGADANAQVCASGSPTCQAYSKNDRAMIALMERHGGALDAVSVGYLHQPEIARKMLAGEIDPRLPFGLFAGQMVAEQLLWSAACGGDLEILRMALARIDWPRDDRRWFWMLWQLLPGHASRHGAERAHYLTCARLMLDRCDPGVRAPRFGLTMLHQVMARDDDEDGGFTKLLLDARARLDVRDDLLRSTPLGWACRWGRVALVKLLLARGADRIEAGADPWATPRAWAEKMGHDDVLTLLGVSE